MRIMGRVRAGSLKSVDTDNERTEVSTLAKPAFYLVIEV